MPRRAGTVENPAAVADVIVAALGLTADGRPAAELLPSVGDLDVLIVLDNAEHVIDGVAGRRGAHLDRRLGSAHPHHQP